MNLAIRTRLTLWYAAVLAIIVVAIAVFLVWRLRADLIGGQDRSLATRAAQTTLAIEDPAEPNEPLDVEDIGAADVAGITNSGSFTHVQSREGRLLGTAGDDVQTALFTLEGVRTLRSPLRTTWTVGDREYRVLAVRLERSGGVLVVGEETQGVRDATRRLLVLLAIAVPAGIGLSAVGGYVLAGRALRPIDRMTRTAAAIGGDDPSMRLDVPDLDDEVGRLGRTLNAMLDRLHTALTEQRRFTADASHELRTPLAIMQTEVDVALRSPQTPTEARPILVSVGEEITRTHRIVEDLLTLARADEDRLTVAADPVDMRDVARSVHDRLSSHAAARGSRLTLDVGNGRAMVSGDAARLDQLLTNLVDNAIKYTSDGGTVAISVGQSDGDVVAEVSDDGPGIPAADVPHIFERFHRVDKARMRAGGGSGLGLAICRAIARAHAGEVDVRSTGDGSVFTVRLPARVSNF